MKTFSNALLLELETKLNQVYHHNENPIQFAILGIKITQEYIKKLKTEFKRNNFQTKREEIEFFKVIKPQFTAKIIYYNQIYKMEVTMPHGNSKMIRKHYNYEVQKIKSFFMENIEFYKYYRTNSTVHDKKYFLRSKKNNILILENYYHNRGNKFTTSHDFKIAKIKANENILNYIQSRLNRNNTAVITNPKSNRNNFKWTGTKVALVELMYALHNEGVLNNGNLSLNEIASQFQTIFNLEIGQFHRIFIEIRNRKTTEKTNFLNALTRNLAKHIADADEKYTTTNFCQRNNK